jgi:acyl carrier protein phosphodiesterase
VNYLAHLYLSDGSPHLLTGGLMGDFVKGDAHRRLPLDMGRGVWLHRLVDAFTDHHPVVGRTIRRLAGRWGKFAGIVSDVLYDHVLATDWARYSRESLRPFADRVYGVLRAHTAFMPLAMRETVCRLIREDKLVSYASEEGIRLTLAFVRGRIQARMPGRDLPLEEAIEDLRRGRAELAADFHEFFPQLIAFTEARKGDVWPRV